MCGVVGIFAYAHDAAPVDVGNLERVREFMSARGPDGKGSWLSPDGRIGLAHRRLAIIDLSDAAAQPMASADGAYRIVFNGEIYNYKELRNWLEGKGYRFVSGSDTEVLLHLYAELGDEMLARLRGMFAFILFDAKKNGVLLARDTFGIKPLYYVDDGRTVIAASQVRALAGCDMDVGRPEPAGHVGYFLFGYVPDPYTLYSSIRAVPAGTCIWYDAKGCRPAKSFCTAEQLYLGSEAHAGGVPDIERRVRIEHELQDAVGYHMVADVPVGLFLSAGIDSTILAAQAARIGGEQLRAITLRFEEFRDTALDEAPLASQTARSLGIPHEVVTITKEEALSHLASFEASMDQPSTDGLNAFLISKIAREQGLKVALSGLGGDELFGGYPSFRRIPRLMQATRFLRLGRKNGEAIRKAVIPLIRAVSSPKWAAMGEYGDTLLRAYVLARALYLPFEIDQFLDPAFVSQGLAALGIDAPEDTNDWKPGALRMNISSLESRWYMRGQLLRDADWAGMANSVEIRVPYADTVLVRAFAALGRGGPAVSKEEAFDACAQAAPREVASRKKSGFATPLRGWLMEDSARVRPQRGLLTWSQDVYHQYDKRHWRRTDATGPRRRIRPKTGLPLVTIVTPSFQQARYLEDTIKSVLNQTYPHIQYVVIDGGSTDGSVDIIRRYESAVSYWCSQRDDGQSDAINKGFQMAKGALVGWLNADDYLEPCAVQQVVTAHLSDPDAVLFHGRLRVVDAEGRFVRYARDHQRPITYEQLLNGLDQLSQPGSFYKSEAVRTVGYLDTSLHSAMDFDLWLKLLRIGPAYYLASTLANYRVHPQAKTTKDKRKVLEESLFLLKKYKGRTLSRRRLGVMLQSLRTAVEGSS